MVPPVRPQVAEAVRQRLAALATHRAVAGLQYVVGRRGGVWLEQCLGHADALGGRPVTPHTTFNAYSITKPLTAAAVVALHEAGRLDLDVPIGDAAQAAGLQAYGSVREALLHRAGFRNPNPLRWIHAAEQHDRFDEAGFVQARIAELQGTRRRLARSGYSNLGYLALGLAVEHAGGDFFVHAVQRCVLQPLQLEADQRLGFAIDDPTQHAYGHLRRHGLLDRVLGLLVDRPAIVDAADRRWLRLRLHQVNGSAYGGLIANARGLARFGLAVLDAAEGTAGAVRERLLAMVPGPGPARSLGWWAGQLGPQRWLAHAGGGLGGYGELRLYPDLGAVSVLLTNGAGLRDVRCLDSIDGCWIGGG